MKFESDVFQIWPSTTTNTHNSISWSSVKLDTVHSQNPGYRLRCHIPVSIWFSQSLYPRQKLLKAEKAAKNRQRLKKSSSLQQKLATKKQWQLFFWTIFEPFWTLIYTKRGKNQLIKYFAWKPNIMLVKQQLLGRFFGPSFKVKFW